MPAPRRIARLQQLILEVAAETVQRELRDPRLGFVTLTHVKLSPDVADAVIFWSVLGGDPERRNAARALSKAAPIVQSIVGKAIGTRTTPSLTLRFDPTIAHAAHLEEIFEKLRQERGEPAAPEAAATPEASAAAEAAAGDEGTDTGSDGALSDDASSRVDEAEAGEGSGEGEG
jgi:ribosome-binding factor A